MNMVRLLSLAAVLGAHLALAQTEPLTAPPPPQTVPSAADFARELKGKLLSWHQEFWRGPQIYQNGHALTEPDEDHLFAVLSEFPDSKEAIERFRTYRLTGTLLYVGGIIPAVGGLTFLLLGSVGAVIGPLSTGALIGLLAITLLGTAVMAVGAVFLNRAITAQHDAVNLYNAALLNRQLPPPEQLPAENVVSFAVTF